MTAKRTSEAVHYHVEGSSLRVCFRETGVGKHRERTLVQIAEQKQSDPDDPRGVVRFRAFEFLQCEHARSLRRQIRKEAQL
jgi:hypothetical protein